MTRLVAWMLLLMPLSSMGAPRHATKRRHARALSVSTHPADVVPSSESALAQNVTRPTSPAFQFSPADQAAPEPARLDPIPGPSARDQLIESHPRRFGLMGGGLALLVASWIADIGVAYGLHAGGSSRSLIPLVGPMIQLSDHYGYQGQIPTTGNARTDMQIAAQVGQANSLIQGITYAALGIDLALQLTGAALAIAGAVSRRATFTRVASRATGLAVRF
jgi:hypothetical protein